VSIAPPGGETKLATYCSVSEAADAPFSSGSIATFDNRPPLKGNQEVVFSRSAIAQASSISALAHKSVNCLNQVQEF